MTFQFYFNNFEKAVASEAVSEEMPNIVWFQQTLLQCAQDDLKEESSSGDDARDLIERCRNKKIQSGRRHHHHHNHSHHSQQESSAAARSSTGGSLGSLHDLSDTKQVKQAPGTQNQGVASRCREGNFTPFDLCVHVIVCLTVITPFILFKTLSLIIS